MAISTQGFRVAYRLGGSGRTQTTLTYKSTKSDYVDVAADAVTFLARLQAVTDAEVLGYNITEVFEESAKDYPENVYLSIGAACVVPLTTPGKTALVKIPAATVGIFNSTDGNATGYNIVDTSDAALLAFMDSFESGGLYTLSDGEYAVGTVDSGERYK